MAATGALASSVPSGSSNKHIKDAFQSYYESLVKAIINPDEIAVKLYSAKVITKQTLSVSVDESKTKYRKSVELVGAVETVPGNARLLSEICIHPLSTEPVSSSGWRGY